MHFFFGDDSQQGRPTRQRMGPLIAVGGVLVSASAVKSLERELEKVCSETGFPLNEEFKWSPGREKWMRTNLVGEERQAFFLRALEVAQAHNTECIVVVNDKSCKTATGCKMHGEDLTATLLERIHLRMPNDSDGCIVIVDRPAGGRGDEDKFLLQCLEQIQSGTKYIKHDKIILNVLSTPSSLVRTLQLADLITACTLSRFSGESAFSPPIFEKILPMCSEENDRKGGVSIKLHPDFKYANLYHWILGDLYYWRFNVGYPFPLKNRPYQKNGNAY